MPQGSGFDLQQEIIQPISKGIVPAMLCLFVGFYANKEFSSLGGGVVAVLLASALVGFG